MNWILNAMVLTVLIPLALAATDSGRLNLLVITADDLNGDTSGWMGDKHAATPELDKLAATAHRFVNCHLTAPICQPSRSALMTGLVPHRSGALGFHPVKAGTPTLVKLLQAQGYYVAVMNKQAHMMPESEFPWDQKFDGSGKEPALWREQMTTAMNAAVAANKPFFINANITDPHRPFPEIAGKDTPAQGARSKNLASASPPPRVFESKDVTAPAFLEDVPGVRAEIAQYYTAVARMDVSLKQILQALSDSGQEQNTVVAFLGDNGMSFPFSKATVYHNGTHEPVLLHFPGMGEPQKREEFVSSVDVLPTLLEILHVSSPAGLDGRSWVPLLRGEKQPDRDYVITHVNTVSSGKAFPQRCIRTKDFSLMFHAWPNDTFHFRVEAMSGKSFNAMAAAGRTNGAIANRVAQLLKGDPLMFFDLRTDPTERTNVIRKASYMKEVERLSKTLLLRMEQTADPQIEAYKAALAHR